MSSIKQRLLEAIERTPEPLLEQTLAFLEFSIGRAQLAIVPDTDSDFDSDTDSKAQILADLKASFQQAEAGQTFPISELWDDINVSSRETGFLTKNIVCFAESMPETRFLP